ncbi:hypothetical protein IOD14_03800 [Streptomyces sp. A2-16]|uniref:hypothetical protein n=1 Tax=Streptomyces sp. A2-16 TaxID=2781734 RepID=UPI001BAEB3DB|nr:hypothetical protein [Streptomyces sp. A2-16]QUC55983.1 hypothetical protein IOD14_03800 [Streptomyces sp. A2-16]
MSRLSRDKKRDHQRGATPIDVRVPLTGESATVAGTPVTAPPGEELQQTVLTHLHRLALSSGHPVHATIHDARIGYVVPLEVATDGASRFTAEPVRMAAPEEADGADAAWDDRPLPSAAGEEPAEQPAEQPWPPAGLAPHDRPTDILRPLEEPTPDPAPTFRLRNLPEPQPTDAEPPETRVRRQLPPSRPTDPAPAPAPGTVVPPTGEFGPPPVMDAGSTPTPPPLSPTDPAYTPGPLPQPTPAPPAPSLDAPPPVATPAPASPRPETVEGPDAPPVDAGPASQPPSAPAPTPTPEPVPFPPAGFAAVPQPLPTASPTPRPAPAPLIDPVLLDDPGPKPAPVRGFDAVAEAVMGEGLVVDDATGLAEPVGRISEAVREGRTDLAAELAERVVGEASETLGAEHPDVLRVRELAAYIAYLGGEPVRAAEISLDLADVHHRAGDAEAAYGNVQSAATAWKAVRDPLRGLALGRELLTLWTELAAGQGPAADEQDRLESARSRMLRLAERARSADADQ